MPVGDESQRNDRTGITHVHHFYTKRNLWVLATFASKQGSTKNYVNVCSVATIITKMYRFRSQGGSLGAGGGPLSGTLYIPSLIKEIPMLKALGEHIKKRTKVFKLLLGFHKSSMISVNSASSTPINLANNNSIDYIFTDPPFGDNIMYSELNFIWESWLRVKTNNESEAIVNKTQNKDLPAYHDLMHNAFKEYYRVLKPGRWMTVVFR